MAKKLNRQVICDVLIEKGREDKDIMVLCSDSSGSSSMTAFHKELPDQFIEVGIAEQNLVTISAGLASCGKKPFAVSPASFLSTRSMEQVKVDVGYSGTNVKLVGVSGGVSYGALGLTHHSVNDFATMGSNPGIRVYCPSDPVQTEKLTRALLEDEKGAYIRVGRYPSEYIYEEDVPFELNKAMKIREGKDAAIIACGEMVPYAVKAAELLAEEGIDASVIDMYCIKPIDREAVLEATKTGVIVTAEEHVAFGGLGSLVSQIVAEVGGAKVGSITLPDAPVIAGEQWEVFDYYGMNAEGIAKTVKEMLAK
ncbi:MAG: transketolase family protein [Lachnospiraceae bacterium]|nr:transketolase family protein [Lachnospiraceae bacterium]